MQSADFGIRSAISKQSTLGKESVMAFESSGSAIQSICQSKKLKQVLNKLKVSALPISTIVKQQFIQVVIECFEALTASNADLRRTSIITHAIKTGKAKPFRH